MITSAMIGCLPWLMPVFPALWEAEVDRSLELLTSGDPPVLASQTVGIISMNHHAQPRFTFMAQDITFLAICSLVT